MATQKSPASPNPVPAEMMAALPMAPSSPLLSVMKSLGASP